ncbi:hypothetical protein FRC18_006336 [Serendipita sp. 400]|nr:hypothetical protein FRC18_006336 [Serendipita sp. 400]
MSEFITTPPRRYYDEVDPSKRIAPQGPSNTIWMGGIPLDLLEQREEIMERFGKFGEIRELRIPPSQVGPRGCMWIQYTRQQDADAAHRELNANPLVLYGRPTRVDYASPRVQSELSKERRAENSVCIHRLQLDLAQDPFTLSKMLETFGEVIDIRVRKAASAQESPIVFVDFSDAEGATRCIQSVHNGELDELLPNISIGYSAQPKVPNWDAMDNQPTDTLRVWNIPARALVDSSMLREAFGGNGHLISTRIPRDRGWPWGVAFLHYTNVEAAKEIFDWVRSDLENPVTFFGRPIRMHFAENLFKSRERWDREREKGERRQDHGWGDRPQTSGDS